MSTSTIEPQHMLHLDLANRVRFARIDSRKMIAALPPREGRQAVGALILECPGWLAKAKLATVLGWPCGSGPTAVRKLMGGEQIGALRTVGELTRRQRVSLAARLGAPAARTQLGGAAPGAGCTQLARAAGGGPGANAVDRKRTPQEADDSPMVGAAAYGTGTTWEEAVREMLGEPHRAKLKDMAS